MATRHAWKLDKKVTAMMVEDMLFDPILASKVLLGVRLPPHEEIRVTLMWTQYYMNDDSGFSTGKSWTAALVSALRSILMPGRVSGILSKTFAQGKLIFANFDRWYNHSPIYRSCVKHAGGKARLIHGTDVWAAHYRGGSETRVLPPNFLQDAERIRSERWHDAYLDEWTTYGNFKALNTTIMGRVTKENHFGDCPVRMNHVHFLSTPQFTHHPAYPMIRRVDQQIAAGNDSYCRFSCNYRHVPDTEEFKFLINRKIIFHMQTTLPAGIVQSEIDGLWAKDSASYYSSKIVDAARLNTSPILTGRLGSSQVFIAAIDVARGGNDSTSANQGDDFAISVFMMIPGSRKAIHVMTDRKSKLTDVQMSGIVHKYHRRFGFSLIVFDPGGGGLFVKDKLLKEVQLIDNEEVTCTPIIQLTDTTGTVGSAILVAFERKDIYVSQMWGKMASASVLVNRAHGEFKGAIENKNVIFPGRWNGWTKEDESFQSWDCDGMRRFMNRSTSMPEKDRLKAESDLAVAQLIHVDYRRDEEGNPTLDSYGMYDFRSKVKKDSAYSLMYAYVGVTIYNWMTESGIIADSGADNGDVVCSIGEI